MRETSPSEKERSSRRKERNPDVEERFLASEGERSDNWSRRKEKAVIVGGKGWEVREGVKL